jgi:hypothetical protein
MPQGKRSLRIFQAEAQRIADRTSIVLSTAYYRILSLWHDELLPLSQEDPCVCMASERYS